MDEFTDGPPPAVGTPAERGNNSRPQPRVPCVGEDAPPYDQQFFLALARRGRDAWNDWRSQHLPIHESCARVTFADVDFRTTENGTIDFSGFIFGDAANLSGATFGDAADLSGATFGDRANLSGATFGEQANLSGSTFGDAADLSGVTFGDDAYLPGATFGEQASLCGVIFGEHANLFGASFADYANLSGATFGDAADLSGVTFGEQANLSGATFGDVANLSGVTFGRWGADLSGVTFGDGVVFNGWSLDEWKNFRAEFATGPFFGVWQVWREDQKQNFQQLKRGRPDRFSWISFAHARFRGAADFSGRQFGETADFNGARFDDPPRFDSMVNIDFYGAKVGFRGSVPGWTTRSDIALKLRHLRKLAEDAKNHDLERDLYIEERKAERGIYFVGHLTDGWRNLLQRRRAITGVWSAAAFPLFVCVQVLSTATRLLIHLGWIAAIFLYWLLADYGRSFIRPLVALLLNIVLFQAAYWLTLRPQQPSPDSWQRVTAALHQAITSPQANDPPFVRATRAFALANAVPFVGALTLDKEVKERLICGDRPVDEKKAAEQGALPCIPIPPLRFQALALLQTIISAVCVFFIALALRNYFRMR